MRKNRFFGISALLALLVLTSAPCFAQQIKGIVHELESSQRLGQVTVKNLRTEAETHTDAEGNFAIAGAMNDLLAFAQPGYRADTAFVYEPDGIQRIYLLRDEKAIVLDEVVVRRLTDSRLAVEIERAKREGRAAEASQHRGGLRVSPSRWFGRKGKLARKDLVLLLRERDERKADRIFTDRLIRSVVPLGDAELPLFRERFRPDLKFLEASSAEDLRLYIMDAYGRFKRE